MTAQTGLPIPQRRWAAFSLAASLVVTVIDATMVTIMLPVIAGTFAVTPAQAIWVMTSYQLTLACLLLPAAALGEKYGQWLVYCSGLALFAAGAVFSTLSTTLATLIAGRVLQGIGAAGIQSMIMALLRHSYPAELFGRASGLNSSVVGISMASGPAAGAAILLLSEWRTLFLLSLPVAAFSCIVGVLALPRVARRHLKIDLPSSLLTALAVLAFVLGLNEMQAGNHPVRMALMLAATVVFVAAAARRLRGKPDPVLPVDILSIRVISLSLTTSLSIFSAQAIAMITLPFYLGKTTAMSAATIGLLITPWPVGMAIMANVSGRLSERYSSRLLCAVGIAIMWMAMVALIFLPATPAPLDVLWRMALFGIGFGLFVTPNNRLIMLNSPLSRAGATGGLVASVRMVGLSVGATLAALVFSHAHDDAGPTAFTLASVLLAIAFTLCLFRKTPRERL